MPKEWPELLTPEQVAEYLQMQPNEIIALLSSGQMPGSIIAGKWRIRKVRLDEWIDSPTEQANVAPQPKTANQSSNLTQSTNSQKQSKQISATASSGKKAQKNKAGTKNSNPKQGNDVITVAESGDANRKVMYGEADRLYKEALAAREQGDIARARELFKSAIGCAPYLNAILAYAATEKKEGHLERALRILQKGIQELPSEGALYDQYGMLLRQRKDLAGAVEILRKGLQTAPYSAKQLHWSLARVLVEIGDDASLQEAADHAEEAKKLGMRLQADPRYKKLRLVNEPTVGRKALDFFTSAGFDSRVQTFTSEYADILVTSHQVEYIESYDLKGGILARCFFRKVQKKDIDNILQTLRQPPEGYRYFFLYNDRFNLNNDIGFLILDDATPWRDFLYRIIEDSREVIIPIDRSLFAQSKGENITSVLQQLLDQWLSRRDLFHDHFPVSGRRFYGRESELQNLMRNIDDGQHTGIYGLRKVGKTSLLYQLQEKRPQDLVVYVDLQEVAGTGVNDCAYLYWAIARGLQKALAENKELGQAVNDTKLELGSESAYSNSDRPEKTNALRFDEDIRRLLDVLAANETTASSKIVITIDELEYMLPIPGYNSGFRGYAEFFAYLRGIAQRTQGKLVSVITAANPAVSEQTTWEGRDNPVFQFYKDTFLPPLAEQECYEMIEKLGRGMGVSFDSYSLEAIYSETGGHPYITRQLCSHVVHQNPSRPLQVFPNLIISSIETFIRDKGAIFGEILDRLENYFPQELDLLLFIAEGLSEELELASLVTVPIDVALRHLIGYQIVDYQDGKYKIKINLLHRWLQRYRLGK